MFSFSRQAQHGRQHHHAAVTKAPKIDPSLEGIKQYLEVLENDRSGEEARVSAVGSLVRAGVDCYTKLPQSDNIHDDYLAYIKTALTGRSVSVEETKLAIQLLAQTLLESSRRDADAPFAQFLAGYIAEYCLSADHAPAVAAALNVLTLIESIALEDLKAADGTTDLVESVLESVGEPDDEITEVHVALLTFAACTCNGAVVDRVTDLLTVGLSCRSIDTALAAVDGVAILREDFGLLKDDDVFDVVRAKLGSLAQDQRKDAQKIITVASSASDEEDGPQQTITITFSSGRTTDVVVVGFRHLAYLELVRELVGSSISQRLIEENAVVAQLLNVEPDLSGDSYTDSIKGREERYERIVAHKQTRLGRQRARDSKQGAAGGAE